MITRLCWSYENRLNLMKWGELLQLWACQWCPHLGAGPHKPQKLQHEHDLAIPYVYPTTSLPMSTVRILCRSPQDRKFCTRRSEIADRNVHSHPGGMHLHQPPISWGPTIQSHRIPFAPSCSDLFVLGWSLWLFARPPFCVAKYRDDLLWEDSCIGWWIWSSFKHLCSTIVFISAHGGNWLKLLTWLLGLVIIILCNKWEEELSQKRNGIKYDFLFFILGLYNNRERIWIWIMTILFIATRKKISRPWDSSLYWLWLCMNFVPRNSFQ